MIIADENISVEFDNRTGCTTRMGDPPDGTRMNWALPQSDWGRIEECDIAGVQIPEITDVNILCNGVAVEGENSREHLSIRITRRVKDGVYTDGYSLSNNGPLEYFINRGEFGIHFPHNCDFSARNPDGGYNYPWMADYYLEWFKFSGESICLENAARILIRYFVLIEGTTQASPGLDVLEVCRAAGKNGLSSLADKLSCRFTAHADLILQSTFSFHSQEVSCTQTQFAVKLLDLCHAYLISGDSKYLAPKDTLLTAVKAMRSYQPDFHVIQGTSVTGLSSGLAA